MRAVVYEKYGSPDVLQLTELPVPEPAADQVLVQVEATGVNLSDAECLAGRPVWARVGGLRSPAMPVLGSDIAGVVAAVGGEVSGWSVGDEVLADNLWLKGGFAEFAVVPADQLAPKPEALSFEEAAAIPQPGAIAHQGVAGVGSGGRILVNGGGGGTGALAIQMANRAGAHVTAVDHAGKLDFLRQLGADEVIDYRSDEFTRRGERWDVILDLVATRSARSISRALAPGGTYRWVGGGVPTLLNVVVLGAIRGRWSGRRIGVLRVEEGPSHFGPVLDLCAASALDVHVGATFSLDEVPEALARVGAGEVLGKAVVRVR